MSRPQGRVGDLTTAIARGDPEAFGAFYEAWFGRAYAMARSITRRDESFCLDVVQDAMLRVVKSLKPLDEEGELERWMARVVHTAALDRLRGEARRVRREWRAAGADPARREASGGGGGPAEALELAEQVAWLAARLVELEEEDRTLFAERFEHGRTFRESGAAAGISGNAAQGRIRRIVARLRALAREVFGDGSRVV